MLDAALIELAMLATILLGGILMGMGIAFRIKKLELAGREEIVQAIMTGIIVGAFVVFAAEAGAASGECGLPGGNTAFINSYSCSLGNASATIGQASMLTLKASHALGYFSSIVLEFTSTRIQPFQSLKNSAELLGTENAALAAINISIAVQSIVVQQGGRLALEALVPLGLVFRSIFLTRKLGAALIAIGIGIFLIYPLVQSAFLAGFTGQGQQSIAEKLIVMDGFVQKYYSPNYIDINREAYLLGEIEAMSVDDFVGGIYQFTKSLGEIIAVLFAYFLLAPAVSAAATVAGIRGLASSLGSELTITWMGAVV